MADPGSGPGKVDFKKTIPAYRARRGFDLIDVPDLQYLMVDGHGDPNTGVFTEAVEALYPVAYKLKFASKKTLGRDYVVMPLEGLWWADDMDSFTAARDKSQWHWTLMIMVPEWIGAEMVASVATPGVRLETLSEGRCVQTLHVGSYDDEAGVLDEMHRSFIPSYGLRMTGKHHEIYLSDRRKTEPAKLRTILRQPVLP
ncbi:GyrI-like domain-containing protein [Actinoplanes sp. LDG1-06]|uniref:GyrI-like domain-containing protein n=1 Tax=Paractinoplanes ovalisporus TaxID=2810368 RepID=A0ABS2AKR1_9ACTN|nr:GyrI-like domain-containing protein [Actinoplanes ovalisporus]MBM2620430.1 GyrI-like domain-containing protein [Actinoplanes ovalisporus]